MTASLRRALATLALTLPLGGCLGQADLDRGLDDNLRFTGRVMGFSLDAAVESLETRLALLRAFEGDPRLPLLEQHLGSAADLQAKLERVQAEKRSLIEENQRLRQRYKPPEAP